MHKRLTPRATGVAGAARSRHSASRFAALPLLAALAVVVPAASETAPVPSWVVLQDGAGHSYDYGNAVTTDAAGNVYVTGSSDQDYVTSKYGPAGDLKWSARYDGPGHGLDNPVAVAVDAGGNVYVTGSSYGGPANLGGSDYDLATIKYSAAGVEQWVQRFNGSGNQGDAARGLALGPEGEVYVTGYAYQAASAWDFITLRYDADGQLRWSVGYDNGFGADRAAAVATDPQGNVYVTGESWSDAGQFDLVSVSYTSDGDRRWLDRYDGSQHGAESPAAITTAEDGTCWVTGTSAGTNNTDVVTLRYDAAGTRLWAARYNGTGNGPDIGHAVVADAAGNCYVAGVSQGAQTGPDYVTLKYGPTGTALWSATYNGTSGGNDQALAVAVRNGKVYVTGQSGNAGGGTGFATLNYSETGSVLWTARYEGPVVNGSGANGMALGADGSLAVVGNAWTTAGKQDIAVLRYPAPAPAAPTGLTAANGAGGVQLTWQHSGEDVTGFIIERRVASGAFTTLAAVGAAPASYLDTQVSPGVTYSYRVTGTGPGGDSGPSNVASVRVPGGVAGKISVSPKKASFGTVKIGRPKVKKIKIKNSGKGDLFGEVALTSGPFVITSGAGAFSLAPKKSLTVTVSFTPAAAGAASGSLQVTSDDPVHPEINVALTAKAR